MLEGSGEGGVCYYSRDFEWEELRGEIESEPKFQSESTLSSALSEDSNEDSSAWEKFHKRHSKGIFFRERRYLLKEFPELAEPAKEFVVLEIGCGAGSSVIPILRATRSGSVRACDLSETALNITRRMAAEVLPVDENGWRLRTFLCDPSTETLPTWLACSACRASNLSSRSSSSAASCCEQGVDFITMVFTMSALRPSQMARLVKECISVLRPGGMIFFRDYGLYDLTMLRFPPEQRVSEGCYRRLDGTLASFFTCEDVRGLFTSAGLIEVELDYCCIKLLNRKKNVPMKRVWIHGKFRKD